MSYILIAVICLILGAVAGVFTTAIIVSGKQADERMEEMQKDLLKRAMSRLGDFGKLFLDYKGCPRGAMGRAFMPLEEEVLLMPELTDVDGGKWIPVNADALHELVDRYVQLNTPGGTS